MELTSNQINYLRNIKTVLDSRRSLTDIEGSLSNFLFTIFKENIVEDNYEFIPLQNVKITKRKYNHGFAIGEVVELKSQESDGWLAINENDEYWISDEEFEIYVC